MNLDYPPQRIHPTPDEVLAVLRDMHRHNVFAYPDVVLSHDTTIQGWREADDLANWKRIAREFNRYWNVDIPIADWKNAMIPADTRRLRDLCTLLAGHIQLPRIRPAHLLGTSCAPAGAFLTVRSYLAAAGANVDHLAPSTPLAPYLRRHTTTFLTHVSQLAPGALPDVQTHAPVRAAGCALFLISLLTTLLATAFGSTTIADLAAAISLSLLCALCITAYVLGTPRVSFPGLHTFRDLATALATNTSPV